MTTACAYYRSSSATNVGHDKDSLPRQRDAVRAYALQHGVEVVREFYDAAVSGADPVNERPGFSEMLSYMLGNGARVVLCENASRFARDLMVQLAGHALLKSRGIELVPVDAPDHFRDETPTAIMVRSILGAVSEFEKRALVAKLRKARDRRSAQLGRRIEGNPSWGRFPVEHVRAAQALRLTGLSLRRISAELDGRGMRSLKGTPYKAASVARMLRA